MLNIRTALDDSSIYNELTQRLNTLITLSYSAEDLAGVVVISYGLSLKELANYNINESLRISLSLLAEAKKDFIFLENFVYEFVRIYINRNPKDKNTQLKFFFDTAIVFFYQQNMEAQEFAAFTMNLIKIITPEFNDINEINDYKRIHEHDREAQVDSSWDINEANKSPDVISHFIYQKIKKYKQDDESIYIPKRRPY